jgi:UDP-glucose 4-epimerase
MEDTMQSDATEGAILVTGIGGLIGSALVRKLLALDRPIVGMDIKPGGDYPFPVLAHNLPDPHRWHEVLTRYKISKIVHAGGVSGPMLYRDAPGTVVDINLSGLGGISVDKIHEGVSFDYGHRDFYDRVFLVFKKSK